MNNPIIVTLYGKPSCHLCHEALEMLRPLQQELGFTVREVNIENDQVLYDRFQYLIPVIDIDNGIALFPPIDEDELRNTLVKAVKG